MALCDGVVSAPGRGRLGEVRGALGAHSRWACGSVHRVTKSHRAGARARRRHAASQRSFSAEASPVVVRTSDRQAHLRSASGCAVPELADSSD